MNLARPVRTVSVLVLLVMLAAHELYPQWNKKPYADWSVRDAERVLNDSPWGKADIFSTISEMFGRTRGGSPAAEANARPDAPDAAQVYFRIRFFSAKPIRLAVSRLLELRNKGPRSQDLEKLVSSLRTGEFYDYVVLTVTLDASGPGINFQEAQGLLQGLGTADIQHNTYLEIKGGRRVYLLEYQTPRSDGLGARFVFPRMQDGAAFITPESYEIHFVAELSSTYKLDKRFKVKDMFYEGRLEY